MKTLDPTKKLDPALFTSEAPTYLNGTTELPKTQKKESKPARKFGMEKVFRGKRVTLSDLLKLPVTSAGWWIGLGDSAEEEKLLEELEESMDVTEEIEE